MAKVKFRQSRVISGREARRLGERERDRERRREDVERFWALTPEERARRMADDEAFKRINRNGITLEDLKRVEDQGRMDGLAMGVEENMRTCYGAFCLALHEVCGFDTDKCREILAAADERIKLSLNSQELLDEVRDVLGLEFHFRGALEDERIQEG